MSRKVLCPACGTINRIGLIPLEECSSCKAQLPITLPRGVVLGMLKILRIVVIAALVGVFLYYAPTLKSLREHQTIQRQVPPSGA